MFRLAILIVALATAALAQTASPADPAVPPSQPTAVRPDPAQQMEQDLNQMESLLNNMAAETAFVKDTNMQILLNTNYRLWSILLRDMRMQWDQQKGHLSPAAPSAPPR